MPQRFSAWLAPFLLLACEHDGRARGDAGGEEPARDSAVPLVDGAGEYTPPTFGESYGGGEFHLGPVDWEESAYSNACRSESGYPAAVRQAEGMLLAGLWNGIPEVASYCDSCIAVQTARGKSAILRVVTYGETTRNSIDVSPTAYQLLNSGEYPRSMNFRFAKCPESGPVLYEFKSASSEWWTSLWVRNPRVPVQRVEVKSQNHDYLALELASDGSRTDHGGFGRGEFTIRVTGMDGQQLVHTFAWPNAGVGGALLRAPGNFE